MISSLANKNINLHQRTNALLQEERVPVGPSNQELLECPQTRVVPQQCLQQFISALRRQRIDAELSVVRFAAPTVLVLRPVVDQKQKPRRRNTHKQLYKKSRGLTIDPLKTFDDHNQRLNRALSKKEALYCVQGALTAVGKIEFFQVFVLTRHI